MKTRGIIFLLITAIWFGLFYWVNAVNLKISFLPATGIALALFVVWLLIWNFAGKWKQKDGEKYAYCFPDPMASVMKKVDLRTQYEGSLLASFLIIIGMILMDIFIVAFTGFSWWFKGLVILNSLFGMLFMLSSLITTYQQYVSYMETTEAIEQARKLMPQPNMPIPIYDLKGGKL